MIIDPGRVWIMPVGSASPLSGPMTRAAGEGWLQRYQNRGNRGPCVYELVPVLTCEICGEICWRPAENPRCAKHRRRNPCAVEGCKRSTKAESRLGRDFWLCGEHWRLGVPAGSPERKAIRRIWRLCKRYDWPDDLRIREDRIWRRCVALARSRARGDLDMDEINRMMGW